MYERSANVADYEGPAMARRGRPSGSRLALIPARRPTPLTHPAGADPAGLGEAVKARPHLAAGLTTGPCAAWGEWTSPWEQP